MPKVSDVTIRQQLLELHVTAEGNWTVQMPPDPNDPYNHNSYPTIIGRGDTPHRAKKNASIYLRDQVRQVAVPFKLANGHSAVARRFSLQGEGGLFSAGRRSYSSRSYSRARKILCWMEDPTNPSGKGRRFSLTESSYSTGYGADESHMAFDPNTHPRVFKALKMLQEEARMLKVEAVRLEQDRVRLLNAYRISLTKRVEEALAAPDEDPNEIFDTSGRLTTDTDNLEEI